MQGLDQDIDVVVHQDLLGPDVWHASLTHRPSGRTGFGTGRSQREAVTKSLGELVERSAFRRYLETVPVRTSNGFAAHVTPELARSAAIRELLERDILLTTWLGRLAPKWQSRATFEEQGIELVTGVAGICGSVGCAIGLLRPATKSHLSFGFVVATSADEDLDAARQSVLFDLRRAATLILQRYVDGKPLFQAVSAADIATGQDHLEYYLDPANSTDLGWFFDGATFAAELPTVAVETVPVPPGDIAIDSLVTYRAIGRDAQDFFFGQTREDLINFPRLRAVAGPGEPNLKLHPLA